MPSVYRKLLINGDIWLKGIFFFFFFNFVSLLRLPRKLINVGFFGC